MKKSEKIVRANKTPAVVTRPPSKSGNFVVKVVTGMDGNEDTARNKRIAERATIIAQNNAFSRSLPISISRNGKIEEIYSNSEILLSQRVFGPFSSHGTKEEQPKLLALKEKNE